MSVVLVSGARTAIGAMGGAFKDISESELAVHALKGALTRAGVQPEDLQELTLGQVISAGRSAYNARRIALESGLREDVPSYQVNQLCGSGMRAAYAAFQALKLGEHQLVTAGGAENMTQAPYILPTARYGQKLGHQTLLDTLTHTLTCGVSDLPMGITAENIAEKYRITRQEQDGWTVISHQRALEAQRSGRFAKEIVPVGTRSGLVDQDERPQETTLEAISKLRPVFKKEGTVTAANASGINDGACMMIFATEDYARAQGLPILARIHGFHSVGVPPELMGLGPSLAIPRLLQRFEKTLSDIDLIEVNEAFAAQFLGVARDLNLDLEKTNVNGGAVALGHPVGMSGARVLYTLALELQERNLQWGVGSLCIGGGQGIACLIERV
ncbi:thiolase family protein [Deinococcus cellulosilyticus]|uniref:Acetyl-CoA acetyltransferase n=1 Tax=Deinococcus cellulosilyticus (strain DSM 18568 / NBRC 106333 / KACC 11606 / 5516J-15) TaxID=1223518 RepID=A0A511MYX1_DEIC1|nr:thiolase family protein [Deinococcus cellulosilyticus]GEM45790.1 acetyl-CoA acetyltransferase [Deinococcus cellulosilyticus NBRC 106333 = KACC 11606]